MFTRLLFGVNCVTDYFTQFFTQTSDDISSIEVLIDDVIIHDATKQDHDKTLNIIFNRLKKEGITPNKDKCSFCKNKIEFLQHGISEKGISVLKSRVYIID